MADSCTWDDATPHTRTGWGLADWEAALQKKAEGPGEQEVEHESMITKPNCISVNTSKSTDCRMREIIIPPCVTLMRLHLKGCVQF